MDEAAPPVTLQSFFRTYGAAIILGSLSLFFIVAALILLFKTTQTSDPIQFSSDLTNASQSSRLVVDIEGAVEKPGLYELPEGSRVEDLLQKAGGITDQADTEWVAKTLNRASFVSDGSKLYIPKRSATQAVSASSGKETFGSNSGNQGTSINTASEKELDMLPGVGPVTVQKIIAGRPYQRLEELLEKDVLSASVYEKLKGQLTL